MSASKDKERGTWKIYLRYVDWQGMKQIHTKRGFATKREALEYGYVIDFADIKKNFDETNEAYLKELNRFNDPAETGNGNTMDTLSQVLESPEELVGKMKEVRQVLFNYTMDNAEDFSSEISTIEDKEELLKLKKVLISARDLCNIVRTFGDEELKQKFEKLEIIKLPSMISEVSHCIDIINQKEVFSMHDETKQIVSKAIITSFLIR